MHQLLDTAEGAARLEEGRVRLAGAIYELETGRVRFLDSGPAGSTRNPRGS